jgi:hypothetical protein
LVCERLVICKFLFAQHFGNDEDKNCPTKSSAGEQINERITYGGEHRSDREDGYENHIFVGLSLVFHVCLFYFSWWRAVDSAPEVPIDLQWLAYFFDIWEALFYRAICARESSTLAFCGSQEESPRGDRGLGRQIAWIQILLRIARQVPLALTICPPQSWLEMPGKVVTPSTPMDKNGCGTVASKKLKDHRRAFHENENAINP